MIKKAKKAFILIFILMLAVGGSVYAQESKVLNLSTYDSRKFHFGFTLGLNMVDYRMDFWAPIGANPDFVQDPKWNSDPEVVTAIDTVRADIASLRPGFMVAIVTDLRLGKYFNLRFLPGLSFGEREMQYSKNGEYLPVYNIYSGTQDIESVIVKSTYLELPLLVKYKASRLNNGRPYVIAGMSYRVELSRSGEEDLLNFKGGSTYLEFGIGLDSYMSFFKLSTELKFSLGIGNILAESPKDQRAYYSQSIRGISSNVVTLCFHFE